MQAFKHLLPLLHLIPFYSPACKDAVLLQPPPTTSLATLIVPIFGLFCVDLSILNAEHWGTGYLCEVLGGIKDLIWMKVDLSWLGLFLPLAHLWMMGLVWGLLVYGLEVFALFIWFF